MKTLPDATGGAAGHSPPWLLERLAFEPEAADARAIEHLEGCPQCRLAVAQLGAARKRFQAEHPTRPFVSTVRARARLDNGVTALRWPFGRAIPQWLLVPAAAVVVVLLALATLRSQTRERGIRIANVADDTLEPRARFKGAVGKDPSGVDDLEARAGEAGVKAGGVSLRLFFARGGSPARLLEPGEALRPGDLLRIGVVLPVSRYAWVVSIDEEGRYSRYYPPPDAATAAPHTESRELQVLPGSVELDETTGREWIALVASPRPLGNDEIRPALEAALRSRRGEQLGSISLDADVAVVPVIKVAR